MQSKTDQLKQLVKKGDINKAIKLLKTFKIFPASQTTSITKKYSINVNDIKIAIQTHSDVLSGNESFYKQLGTDLELQKNIALDYLNTLQYIENIKSK